MLPLIMFVCFLAIPVAEIYVILQVGQLIGAWPTVLLLLFESVLGAWIVRREGRRAWRALQDTLRTGAMPERELVNASLILIGGTLLLTPGFVTDVFGFAFVLPFTRPLVRVALSAYAARRFQAHMARHMNGPHAGRHDASGQQPGGHPRVVRGHVVDDY